MADQLTRKSPQAAAAGGASSGVTRNGVPLLPVRPGAPHVTPELVRQLQEELH